MRCGVGVVCVSECAISMANGSAYTEPDASTDDAADAAANCAADGCADAAAVRAADGG
jgi:hypothetical protein